MLRICMRLLAASSSCLALASCSTAPMPPGTGPTDAGAPIADGGASKEDATAKDAGPGTDSGAYVFAFSVTLNGEKVAFERGQFGTEGADLYLELHDGGDPACPTENSPTPKHTLIVSGLKTAGTSAPTVTLVDFIGDVITTPKPSRTASLASATVRVASESRIELDLSVTFDSDGTGAGQVVADHCASLDAKK